MDKSIYLEKLDELTNFFETIPNTPMAVYFKVLNLATLNMRYEKIAFNRDLDQHPYLLVRNIIQEQLETFKVFSDVLFIESVATKDIRAEKVEMEEKHQDLFNLMWDKYDADAFENYVDRYKHRIRVNNLEKLIEGKRCLDFGCGNGNFCFALADLGASFVAGVDFGPASIRYANQIREQRQNGQKCEFRVSTVYDVSYPDDSFDFVIQNGVFHHLTDEFKAILEAKRVLKTGGYFWYYTDGEGGISYDLWDRSVFLLREVPTSHIQLILQNMNVSTNKTTHLLDGLKATYRHTSWEKITKLLGQAGFGDFRRLVGGFETDFDLDVIEADSYGREKFGEGDLRILARLLEK